jgi:pimeloyl-ACP methyl ester carboxylesterase
MAASGNLSRPKSAGIANAGSFRDFGLHCIRPCAADTIIVFVHGILSSGEDAWGSPSWPDLLAAEPEFNSVGIFVFTYETGLGSRTYGIADVADNLREHLRLSNLLNSRKIVFVCHSMGGIVVRRFLVANQRALIASKPNIGLFLVASPSLGSRDANMLSLLSFALQHTQAAALRFSQANTSLDELHRDFRTLLSSGDLRIEGRELTEDRPITVKRWLGLRRQVVEPFAASLYFHKPGCEPLRVPGSDHANIVKPLHSGAIQHLMLKKFISEFIFPYNANWLERVNKEEASNVDRAVEMLQQGLPNSQPPESDRDGSPGYHVSPGLFYFCYISSDKVEQYSAQLQVSTQVPALPLGDLEPELAGLSKLISAGAGYGRADDWQTHARDREDLVNRLIIVLRQLASTRRIVSLRQASDGTARTTGVLYVRSRMHLVGYDQKIALLHFKLGTLLVELSCSIRYFSEYYDPSVGFSLHSGNYHFFEGKISPIFDAVIVPLDRTQDRLVASPLFLALETNSGTIL